VAVVTDNLAYGSSYQAFERPPDSTTLFSLVPRGVRRFFFAAALTAKPVNDTYIFFLTATLPENFAYIMRSINLLLSVDTASDWTSQTELRMSNHIPGQALGTTETMYAIAGTQPLGSGGDTTKSFQSFTTELSHFTSPMWSVHGGSITFRVSMSNTAAAVGAAGFLISHCEFYEYDLTQAQRYYINTPVPVLGR